jgi:predicted aspartyl protease
MEVASPTDVVAGLTQSDRRGRVVAPVYVNGQGPFRFIIDTGANRSVISERLAQRLGLTPHGAGVVHTIQGQMAAPLVGVQTLSYGGLSVPGETMPLLGPGVLAGEFGLLGVDGMRGRRLRFDFERHCVEIVPSEGARPLNGWTRLRGELRFGYLVVVPGEVRGLDVNVLIDTGSDISLANSAFRRAAAARTRPVADPSGIARALTASVPIVLNEAVIIPRLEMGAMNITNMVAFVGDYHVFSLWGFQEEPTLLVGMDVLSRTRGLAIDYGDGSVHFQRAPLRGNTERVTYTFGG